MSNRWHLNWSLKMSKILLKGEERTFVLAWIPPRSRAWARVCTQVVYFGKWLGRDCITELVSALGKWSSVPLETTEEPNRMHFHPRTMGEQYISTGSQPPLVHKVAPGLLVNTSAFPGLHMPRKSWAASPSYSTLQWKRSPEAEKIYVVQLKQGVVRLHLCTAGCHSNTWNKKVWCERSIRHVLHNILLRVSQTWAYIRLPKGLVNTNQWALPPPRVSGSEDVVWELRINISSIFFVWAFRLLKTAVHSVQGQQTDQVGEREVS